MAGGVVFAIDVSGSMRETLRDPAVNAIARALATEERPSKIVAVDTSVVGTWDISEDGFQSALNAGGGATELQQPVRELLTQFGSVVLFTDSDGLTSLGDVPYSQYPNTNGTGSAVTIVRCQPIAAEGS
jgi:predicted metal-dependent peptidase